MIVAQLLGQTLAENQASERTADKSVARDLHANLRLQIEHLLLIGEQCLRDPRKDFALTDGAGFELREVV